MDDNPGPPEWSDIDLDHAYAQWLVVQRAAGTPRQRHAAADPQGVNRKMSNGRGMMEMMLGKMMSAVTGGGRRGVRR
jgi:hypothetical protein